MFNYKTPRPAKEFVLNYQYDVPFKKFNIDIATILAGPTKKNLDRIFELEPNHVVSYENDQEAFIQQLRIKNRYFKSKSLGLSFDNVENAAPSDFMDIDLMKTYINVGDVVKSLLKKQYDADYPLSVFICTFSTRGVSLEEFFIYLEELIAYVGWCQILTEVDFEYTPGKQFSYVRKHVTRFDSRIKAFDYIAYSDSCHMASIRLIY